ncbi:MAG TPA: hypothetical protein VG736_04780 [Vicinamibacterales bacterium]|jgi:hypothetical protein|nr:hypothetical protein [Vicinamibacterales bacterium]
MKKLAIGCGIVVLLAAIAGAVGIFYFAHKVGSTVRQFAALGSIPEIERQVQDTRPYDPPASGELTDAQLAKLLAVQGSIKQQLGTRFQELDGKYRALSKSLEHRDANVTDAPALLGAYADLAATYLDAKRWQVEALNAQHLSLAEYRWIRKQAYSALGLPVMDFDLARIVEDVKAGRTSSLNEMQVNMVVGPTGPDANQTLVQPQHKTLEDNVALAFLGL